MYTNTNLPHSTLLSPNYSKRQSDKLKYMLVHCVVGQHSAIQTAQSFAKESRQASSNYIVGKDGEICLCVEEQNRAWTSGGKYTVNGLTGRLADHAGITIEVASDPKTPYAFNDKAYTTTIQLVAEILQRNGKTKLVYIPDKNQATLYEPQDNEMVLMYHRWFDARSCPGDWFVSKAPEFVNAVNALLGNVQPVQPQPQPVQPIADEVYIVKKGDTLSKIARQYNTTYQKIARDNKIANPNIIYPGQKLIIKH